MNPCEAKMLRRVHALKIGKRVVADIVVPMVDVAVIGNRTERRFPNISVQFVTAPCPIPATREKPIQAAIEIDRERVKDDRIGEQF